MSIYKRVFRSLCFVITMILLPAELLLETFTFLSYYDLKRCESVSWGWSALISGDSRLQYLLFKPHPRGYASNFCKLLQEVPSNPSRCSPNGPGHLVVRPHPVLSKLTYRFGDTIENAVVEKAANPVQIANLSIAEDFVCIPPVTEMTISVHRRGEECSPLSVSDPITCRVENKQGIRVLDALHSLVDEGRKKCNLMSLFGGGMLCARLHGGQRPGLCMKANLLGKQRAFHSLNITLEPENFVAFAVVETTAIMDS
ncbi:hypothetical protein CPB83DRAFT_881301 [Crepidotus variabilis]|uniref:F-box domain-containing protein n=1 Tax=Crepidotus variabilis TaxID=179855 RepID=A0A9P6EM70_9AGAR|nr:hypothetical protein CPB83DRAFT_881301 [Crepidotus variabilis]